MNESIDIIAITESWMKLSTRYYSGEFTFPDYSLFHKDRQGQEGRGVLFLMKITLQILEVTIPNNRHNRVSIQVVSKHIKCQTTFVYHPPRSKVADDINLYNTLVNVVTTQYCTWQLQYP
ncbi:hypothetical protein EQH57_0799 [Dictyocoela roeselum]|nr:hypothetical protein EQH57_0799 [Dictyocoela roeselum]